MQKKFLALAIVAASAGLTSVAYAEQPNGWFVNGNAGRAHYDASVGGYNAGSETGTAFIVNAGYRDQNILGFEAGYTNLGSISKSDGYGTRAKLSGDGWTLGLNGHFNPTRQWYLSARGGAFQWKLKAKATVVYADNSSDNFSGSKQSLGWYAGVGTGYDIDRHWSVGANFDYYKINNHDFDIGAKLLTVSAEYRF